MYPPHIQTAAPIDKGLFLLAAAGVALCLVFAAITFVVSLVRPLVAPAPEANAPPPKATTQNKPGTTKTPASSRGKETQK
jgi:hypothetical protein